MSAVVIDLEELRLEVQHILSLYPRLCQQGWRVAGPRDNETDFQRFRDFLLDPRSLEEFARARDWWRRQRKTVRENPKGTTRTLLQIARSSIGECSVGAFTCAGLSCGFTAQVDPASRFCWFNVASGAWNPDQ